MSKYIYGLIIALFLYVAGSEVYKSTNKKSAKSTRLACHESAITFERVYQPERVQEMIETFKSGNVELKSKFKLAEYMESKMGSYITIEEIDAMFKEQIAKHHVEKENSKNLLIDYFVYENDKEDPGKKTKKSKLYAGYLRLIFILEGEKVYSFQIDFKDLEGKDIPEKVVCTVDSLLSL